MPYLEIRPSQPPVVPQEAAIAFPPLEGSPPGAEAFQLIDWEVIAQMRGAGLQHTPHCVLVFLELLRCVASPSSGPRGAPMPVGVCQPHVLPQDYFRENPEKMENYKRVTRLLRRGFLSLYGHVLINCLARKNEEWVAAIFDCPNIDERMRKLTAALRRANLPEEGPWAAVATAATLFAGSHAFCQLYPTPESRRKLPLIPTRAAGAPTRLFVTLFEKQFSQAPKIALPAPLAMILHITLDDRNQTGTLPLFPKALRDRAYILCDNRRIERAEEMLCPNEEPSWLPIRFIRQELAGGTDKPSLLYTTHASFCMLLERLLTTDLTLEIEHDELPPETPTVRDATEAATERDAALIRQINFLGESIARDTTTIRSGSKETRASRLRETHSDTFHFSADGFATLTLPQREPIGHPLACTVQRASSGLQDIGTIWVPIARHLVRDKLHIDLHVLYFESTPNHAPGWRLTPLPAALVDYFIIDAGALLCVELERGPDGTFPRGLSATTFCTQASMRLTSVSPDESGATLTCAIACFDVVP